MIKITDNRLKLIETIWVIISTIYTLVFAAIATITNFESRSVIYAFMVGVCVIILQSVIYIYYINIRGKSSHEVIQELKDYINRKQNLLLPDSSNNVSDEIENIIQNEIVKRITIICYGTSGFGGLIDNLYSSEKTITTNILVCSPESPFILHESDRQLIRDLIRTREKRNITFTKSPIPSTVRACILYDKKNKPIWSSIQTYYYNHNAERHSFDYKKSFTVIARKDSSNILLAGMQEIIEKEFYRLENFDLKQLGLNACQIKAIRYIEKNEKITIKEYCQINNNKNKTKAINDLQALINKGIIEKISEKKKIQTVEKYVLTTNYKNKSSND